MIFTPKTFCSFHLKSDVSSSISVLVAIIPGCTVLGPRSSHKTPKLRGLLKRVLFGCRLGACSSLSLKTALMSRFELFIIFLSFHLVIYRILDQLYEILRALNELFT